MFGSFLLDVLADNGRLTLTGDVISAFGKMMSAHRGEVICSVTTAQVGNVLFPQRPSDFIHHLYC